MDSNGGFHEVEKDGKLFLVYHHPKYCPIPETQTLTSPTDLPLQPLFLCPRIRKYTINSSTFLLNSSPEYVFPTTTDSNDHHVLPLFWCNNKEFDADGGCDICGGSNFGTDYYFCNNCDKKFHRECVQSPLKIKHPYHPEHSLQLYFLPLTDIECLCCRRRAMRLVYHCTICQAYMHPTCAMKPIPFIIDPPKQHIHPLTFFPRQIGLTCNVCGLSRKTYPTYVCLRCNFVAHNDCMNFPHIIKISRHHHRISFTLSFLSRERLCGVCRQSVNGDYGAYTCDKCNDYAVHSICATRKDLWDGKELEGVPEEDDITENVRPFEMISEGEILHFLHDHPLRLESIKLFDENKFCQACVLPIYEGNFYSCVECEFILHENCAKAPRRIQHALHRHPLTLKAVDVDYSYCDACDRRYSGFYYGCYKDECRYTLDVRCASISEPFDYKGHEHPLFLALNPEVKPICHVCKRECQEQLNCIQCGCNFIVCFRCVTLPYKTKYKHDTHFLTISYGEEVREKDWCEVCEQNLKDTGTKVFYWCNECYTTFHIECVLGEDPYMKLGKYPEDSGGKFEILGKCNISRPLCYYCKKRCQGKIFKRDNNIACSMICLYEIENL
ncbi:uncharacterized protein LOC110229230 [Arabidopsis lyrata subsp. lyrata]|uniref:uncharacterized protein LOC110229230 n=1 Tax=Arabidopsis lyrata subsp. lyrata TaxID=81972 RepID=UPI000A29D524|nr:uncharacterized protein LOC110229230 [Arabidopsis lyrata subsp. lyrata]|eukprot:XP_020884619.1 uncharacterized protein LOC110229230 [Arabidopsis lyrata subsp. lyrata]